MNDKPIYFSVCRYIPDILRGESINVGIVVHIPEHRFIKFYKTKNLSRVRSFDDEVEMEVIKALLESLEYQFNYNRASELKGLNRDDFLKNELVYFINQVQFSEIRVLNSDINLFEENIKDLIDMYLYYDKKKSERIDRNRVRSLASKIVSQSYLKNSIDRNPKLKNNFNQQAFDFSLDFGNQKEYIRAISFDYKNTNKFFNEIKSFLYDVSYFKNNLDVNIKVVINNTDKSEMYEQVAYDTLKNEVDIFTLEEFDKFVRGDNYKDEQLNFFDL